MKTRNKFEKKLEQQLRRSKCDYDYESERIPYTLNGIYIPDFRLRLGSKHIIYIEAKGYLRPEHKRKMVAVKRQHPELDIRFVFYRHVEIYIKWADKHGFPWAIGSIPKEWLT